MSYIRISPGEDDRYGEFRSIACMHREETEVLGCLQSAALETLKHAGFHRFFVPQELGGLGGELSEGLKWLTALAEGSGSIAWATMVIMQTPFLLSLFSLETMRSVYAGGPDVILASSSICAGKGVPMDGRLEVSGTWPLVTGADYCDFFMGHAQMPMTRDGLLPKRGVLVRPPWINKQRKHCLLGLAGSNTFHVDVPAHQVCFEDTFEVGSATSCFATIPEFRIPVRVHFALHMAAVAVGIAAGAAHWFVADPSIFNPASDKRNREHDGRLTALGESLGKIEVQRLALDGLSLRALNAVTDGPMDLYTQIAIHSAATIVSYTCLNAVSDMWNNCNSRALNHESAFQACLRDLQTLTRHANMSRGIFNALGQANLDSYGNHSKPEERRPHN